jgi:hypothetical protein
MEVSSQLHALSLYPWGTVVYTAKITYVTKKMPKLYGDENRSEIKLILDVNSRNYRSLPQIVLLTS